MVEGFALSPQQRRLWSLQDPSDSWPYTTRATVRISGRLDRAALRSALERVVARHEILRTTFFATESMSVPVQVILAPDARTDYEDVAGLTIPLGQSVLPVVRAGHAVPVPLPSRIP